MYLLIFVSGKLNYSTFLDIIACFVFYILLEIKCVYINMIMFDLFIKIVQNAPCYICKITACK